MGILNAVLDAALAKLGSSQAQGRREMDHAIGVMRQRWDYFAGVSGLKTLTARQFCRCIAYHYGQGPDAALLAEALGVGVDTPLDAKIALPRLTGILMFERDSVWPDDEVEESEEEDEEDFSII